MLTLSEWQPDIQICLYSFFLFGNGNRSHRQNNVKTNENTTQQYAIKKNNAIDCGAVSNETCGEVKGNI